MDRQKLVIVAPNPDDTVKNLVQELSEDYDIGFIEIQRKNPTSTDIKVISACKEECLSLSDLTKDKLKECIDGTNCNLPTGGDPDAE